MLGAPLMMASARNHGFDANTLALWRLDALETIAVANQQRDVGGNYHLTLNTGTEASPSPLIPDGGRASTKDIIYRCATDAALVTALKASAGWSVELWFNNVDSVVGADNMLCCIGTATGNHFSEQEEDLFLIRVAADGKTAVSVSPPGSTSNAWNEYKFGTFPTSPGIHHLALTWLPVNPTDATLTAYLDGALHGSALTAARLTAANAGTNSIIQLRGYPANNYRPMNVVVDDVRLSKTARTAAEVLASYRNGV